MSAFRLILRSLWHHGPAHLAAACGVAAATAVLTGALLVGDSMRGSLRGLALDRLGNISETLVAPQFFRAALAGELTARLPSPPPAVVPAIVLTATVENGDVQPARTASHVNLLAAEPFAPLFPADEAVAWPQGTRDIVLNRPLAEQLGVQVGDEVLLRLPRRDAIPADSGLGRKRDTVVAVRRKVMAICPPHGPGRFSMQASQQVPYVALLSLAGLQQALDEPERANAMLVARDAAQPPSQADCDALQQALRPELADEGLRLLHSPLGYWQITSDQMILSPPVEQAITAALSDAPVQPVLTYLANTLSRGTQEIPYSTIAAIDFRAAPPLGPMVDGDGHPVPALKEGQIALNSWAAEQLQAKPGDNIRVSYYRPESLDGRVAEQTVDLTLAAIVALSGAAADRDLTPAVRGVTEQISMRKWTPPFPFQRGRIREQDEEYWRDHGATPKAFVSLATGRRLWGSRFGHATALRFVAPPDATAASLAAQLTPAPSLLGMDFQPVRLQALQAAAGSTPFDVLFLLLSCFVIAAAVMLIALMYRLGIERRAREVGILTAMGFARRRVARLLMGEGAGVALLGSGLGLPLGVGYAALMLWGLRTWWLPAVGTPFLRLHASGLSLALGLVSGTLVALLAIGWAVRRTRRLTPRQLLAGQVEPVPPRRQRRWPVAELSAGAIVLAAIAIGWLADGWGGEAQAGAFFAAGSMVLFAGLLGLAGRLRFGGTGAAVAVGCTNVFRMATRNAARHPGRSLLCVGLVGSTTFLIVAIGAFQIDPSQLRVARDSGNGGFALYVASDRPIYADPAEILADDTPAGAKAATADPIVAATFYRLPVRGGDDASCLNLYRPRQPRIVGIPHAMIDRGGFAWSDVPAGCENPWRLLAASAATDADGSPLVPVVLDKNTANYALNLWKGLGERFDVADSQGRPLRFAVAALLDNSIFEGDLLIGDAAFRRCFPEISGCHIVLVECPQEVTAAVRARLESGLGDYGLTVQSTPARLANFLVVQNTYLSAFRSLGGLGLLLGTFGLAAVQLRSVLERSGELALLCAAGFRRRTLAWLVVLENGLLLLAGLAIGAAAALVAVLPQLSGRSGLPWTESALTLGAVLIVGLASGAAAARAVLRLPIAATLRREG